MKTLIYVFALFIGASVLLSSCEEELNEGLLKDLAEGKMVVVFDEGEEELFNCSFNHYGEGTGLTGEVFIDGMLPTSTEKYFTIMYGSWSNDVALTTKTYSTAVENDMISISSSYGYIEDGAVVSIQIVEITTTAIKGTFTGNLKAPNGLKTVKGAFWALKGEEHTY